MVVFDGQGEDVVVRVLCREQGVEVVGLGDFHVFAEFYDLWCHCRNLFSFYHLGEIRLCVGVLGLNRLPVRLVDLVFGRESHL